MLYRIKHLINYVNACTITWSNVIQRERERERERESTQFSDQPSQAVHLPGEINLYPPSFGDGEDKGSNGEEISDTVKMLAY